MQQIEQGASNVANSVASNTTTTLSEDGSGYTYVYEGYIQPLDTLESWLKGLSNTDNNTNTTYSVSNSNWQAPEKWN